MLLAAALVVTWSCTGDGGDDADGRGPTTAPRGVPEAGVQIGAETDEAAITAASSPVLAANPEDPRNYVIGHRVELPRYSCSVAASADAGATWTTGDLTLPPGTERCYTMSLAFDRDGVLHLVFVTLSGTGNVPDGAWLARSTDGGRTFSPPARVLDREKFQVRLLVDPATSPPHLYLSWVEASGIGFLQMAPPSRVMVRASTDGGATFGAPVQASAPGRDRVGAAVPVLRGPGALTVLYFDYGRDAFNFQNVEGTYQGTFELIAANSSDGAASFREATVDRAVVPPEPFLVFLPPLPTGVTDGRGRTYVAWSDRRPGRPAVLLSTSDDGGLTWAPPRRVDGAEGEALLPQLALAPGGRLDVAWAEVGDGAGGPTRVRFTASDDRAATFGPVAAANEPFPREWLPASPRARAGARPDLGSALAVLSADDAAYLAWPDTRKGGADTRRTDIVGARVRVTASGEPRSLPAAA